MYHNFLKKTGSKKWLIFITILSGMTLLGFLYRDYTEKQQNSAELSQLRKQLREEEDWVQQKEEAEKLAQRTRQEDILSRIPGIVCWGDSLTAGAGGGGYNLSKHPSGSNGQEWILYSGEKHGSWG